MKNKEKQKKKNKNKNKKNKKQRMKKNKNGKSEIDNDDDDNDDNDEEDEDKDDKNENEDEKEKEDDSDDDIDIDCKITKENINDDKNNDALERMSFSAIDKRVKSFAINNVLKVLSQAKIGHINDLFENERYQINVILEKLGIILIKEKLQMQRKENQVNRINAIIGSLVQLIKEEKMLYQQRIERQKQVEEQRKQQIRQLQQQRQLEQQQQQAQEQAQKQAEQVAKQQAQQAQIQLEMKLEQEKQEKQQIEEQQRQEVEQEMKVDAPQRVNETPKIGETKQLENGLLQSRKVESKARFDNDNNNDNDNDDDDVRVIGAGFHVPPRVERTIAGNVMPGFVHGVRQKKKEDRENIVQDPTLEPPQATETSQRCEVSKPPGETCGEETAPQAAHEEKEIGLKQEKVKEVNKEKEKEKEDSKEIDKMDEQMVTGDVNTDADVQIDEKRLDHVNSFVKKNENEKEKENGNENENRNGNDNCEDDDNYDKNENSQMLDDSAVDESAIGESEGGDDIDDIDGIDNVHVTPQQIAQEMGQENSQQVSEGVNGNGIPVIELDSDHVDETKNEMNKMSEMNENDININRTSVMNGVTVVDLSHDDGEMNIEPEKNKIQKNGKNEGIQVDNGQNGIDAGLGGSKCIEDLTNDSSPDPTNE